MSDIRIADFLKKEAARNQRLACEAETKSRRRTLTYRAKNHQRALAEIERLTAEVKISRAFVERIAKQPLLDELPEDAEGGDPEGGYDAIVSEARDALARLSGRQEQE